VFSELNSATQSKQSRWLGLSVGVHLALLAWLLYVTSPRILVPVGIQHGFYGKQATSIYWPAPEADGAGGAPQNSQHDMTAASRKLRLPPRAKTSAPAAPVAGKTETVAEAGNGKPEGPSAGSPYGSLMHGPLYGHEIRPALPIRTMDPVVDPSGVEGSVVVEITIDDHGKIVQKTVIQSLGPAVDAMVLAALNDWEFRPATRDGMPIASKQDVYYHFPIRR
jgi:protein TonB